MSQLKLPYLATAAISGTLFGAGLYISQMIDPLKVLHFLDFGAIPTGGWDPSLIFVMLPALLVMFVALRLGKSRPAPLFDVTFHQSEFRKVDGKLIGGATLFGIGWGMAGICPGPAIALLAFMPQNLFWFLIPMILGSWLGGLIMPSGHARRLEAAQ